MMEFLYPSELFNNKKVDESFKEEFDIISKDFKTHLIDIDNLESAKKIIATDNVLYRGWMLSEEKYELLYKKIVLEDNFPALKVSPKEYLDSHHLPNWYENIKDYTPQSIITSVENIEKDFKISQWGQAFIKDYVKSIKTGKGSIVSNTEDIKRVIEDMLKYKGFIEGGLILREVKNFIPETEVRFFVLNNQLYSPSSSVEESKIQMAEKIVEQFPNKYFFSIDVISDKKGKNWVVEIGDGQVSDYVGWEIKNFTSIFNHLKYQSIKTLKV